MAEPPQVESPNLLTLDYQDAPELREIFQHKDTGDKCKLTMVLQVNSKYPEGVQCSIEKIITEAGDYGDEDNEVEPDNAHPVMATIKKKNRKNRGMQGPHESEGGPKSRPPQTAENSAEPWITSYT